MRTGNSADEDLQKNLPEIENILDSKSLWAFCHHEDTFVRRSIYNLLRSAVSREPGWLDWNVLSTSVIGKSLSIPQIGSASELSESLLLLTSSRPQVWTEDYTGKSSPSKRLRQYIKKGSQGGSATFWSNLDQLLRIVPLPVLAGVDKIPEEGFNSSSAVALTEAFQDGLNSREEPRQNLPTGWKSYIETGVWLATLVPPEQKFDFVQQRLSPLVEHYVHPEQTLEQWNLPTQSAESTCVDYLSSLAVQGQDNELMSLWTKLSSRLLEAVKLSSPAQSKEFRSSQDLICAQSKRLFALQTAVTSRLTDTKDEERMLKIFETSSSSLLEGCLQVLRSRNGKPYGAAAVIEDCVRHVPQVAQCSDGFLRFAQKDAPDLLLSPSADRLITIIRLCREWDGFESSFENIVEQTMELEPEQSNAHVLQSLLSTLDFNEVENKAQLASLVKRALDKACRGSHPHWPTITAVLQNKTSRGELMDSIFLSIIDFLSSEDTVFDALHGLSQIGKTVPSAVREFQSGPHGSKLAGKLLYLTESPSEEVANLAESLTKTLKETVVGDTSVKSNVEILRHGFSRVNEESLS